MSQTESGVTVTVTVRRRKSYDDLCDLQFVPYEASRLFFKALTDSASLLGYYSLLRQFQFVPWCNNTLTVEVFTAIQTSVLLVHFF